LSEPSGASEPTNATQHDPLQKPQTEPTLARLMSEAAKAAPLPDLDQAAQAAAEQAIAESELALDEAAAELETVAQPAPARPSRARELTLRILLGVNLLAMVVVALLPSTAASPTTATATTSQADDAVTHEPAAPTAPVQTPTLDDPVIRAFAAADTHDYRTAIALLEQHLAETPRLEPARKANILLALQHYAAQIGDFGKSQEFQRKVEALRNSHSMPEDLIAMAAEAEKAGDIEAMRQHYARLLLQQRQIPSSLYRHVAEAYLKLGDSYRTEAEKAARASRQQELEQLNASLREQAAKGTGK
jgi:tetratricopeptide (TPR) repeat protein